MAKKIENLIPKIQDDFQPPILDEQFAGLGLEKPVSMGEIINKDLLIIPIVIGGYISASVTGGAGGSVAARIEQRSETYGTIFIANFPYEIVFIKAIWGNAASSGTLDVVRVSGTDSVSSGTTVLASAFDVTGTANTVNTRSGSTLTNTLKNRILNVNDRLGLKASTNFSSFTNLNLTLGLKPLAKGSYKI